MNPMASCWEVLLHTCIAYMHTYIAVAHSYPDVCSSWLLWAPVFHSVLGGLRRPRGVRSQAGIGFAHVGGSLTRLPERKSDRTMSHIVHSFWTDSPRGMGPC